jgi:hypothetical protein
MKPRRFNGYYNGVMGCAVIVVGVAGLASEIAHAASTDVAPRSMVLAGTSQTGPAQAAPLQLAQNDGAATGSEGGTPTAADDAAAIFAPAGCGAGAPGCGRYRGGSGNGGAAGSGNGGQGASGNGAGGAAGSGSGSGSGSGGSSAGGK